MAEVGRPSVFSKEIADTICEKIVEGNSLRTICSWDGMPSASSVFKWLREMPDFSKQYARACEERTEAFAEDILQIADNGVDVVKAGAEKKSSAIAQMVRLQVDTRKWHMSKMKPKKYGDALDLTTKGEKIAVLPAELYAKRNSSSSSEPDSERPA